MPAPRKPQDRLAKAVTPKPDPRGKVEGKVFTWTTEDDATLTIPLRMNVGTIRLVSGDLDIDAVLILFDEMIPDQRAVVDATDVNDVMAAFTAWQSAYNDRTGATLGESSDSST